MCIESSPPLPPPFLKKCSSCQTSQSTPAIFYSLIRKKRIVKNFLYFLREKKESISKQTSEVSIFMEDFLEFFDKFL